MSATRQADAGFDAERRRELIRGVASGVLFLLTLVVFIFVWLIGHIMCFGLFSGAQSPQIEPEIVLPILGGSLLLVPAPLLMATGRHPRRWRLAALAASGFGLLVMSLGTWLGVLLVRSGLI